MGLIRYGKVSVSTEQQGQILRDLPHHSPRDCYFTDEDVAARIMQEGADTICSHCGQPSRISVSPRQAKALAQRMLDYWRKCDMCTYSNVLDKYRKLP